MEAALRGSDGNLSCLYAFRCTAVGTIDGGALQTKGYPIEYPLQWFLWQNPLMGVL